MTPVPEDVPEAALYTVGHAPVYARNLTFRPTADPARQANDPLAAIHGVPGELTRWEPRCPDVLRQYFVCFQPDRWPGAPDLPRLFDSRLSGSNRRAP